MHSTREILKKIKITSVYLHGNVNGEPVLPHLIMLNQATTREVQIVIWNEGSNSRFDIIDSGVKFRSDWSFSWNTWSCIMVCQQRAHFMINLRLLWDNFGWTMKSSCMAMFWDFVSCWQLIGTEAESSWLQSKPIRSQCVWSLLKSPRHKKVAMGKRSMWGKCNMSAIRATSHMRLRAHDHYTSSTLLGGKGRAGPSSLHTTLEGTTEYVNARWM
jgi:hypothetical protein